MSLKERGVAVLLAAENAETIEPTAKWKSLTLADMVPSKVSRDSELIKRMELYFLRLAP
jgi:hypothetical protein